MFCWHKKKVQQTATPFVAEDGLGSGSSACGEHGIQPYISMRVDVFRENQYLFSAVVLSIENSVTVLQPDQSVILPVREDGIPVTLRGYHRMEGCPVYFSASLQPSLDLNWRACGLAYLRKTEERETFRLSMRQSGSLAGENGKRACDLVDVSIGGARFVTDVLYSEGDKSVLGVDLEDSGEVLLLPFEILRVRSRGEKLEYGCRFVFANLSMQDKLMRSIFSVQRERKKAAMAY